MVRPLSLVCICLLLSSCQSNNSAVQTQVFHLHNTRAHEVLDAIRDEGTFGAKVTADTQANTIVVEGPIRSLVQLRAVITELDAPK